MGSILTSFEVSSIFGLVAGAVCKNYLVPKLNKSYQGQKTTIPGTLSGSLNSLTVDPLNSTNTMASMSNKITKPILKSESSLSTRQSIEIPDFVESAKHHHEHGLPFMIPSTPCSDHPMMFEITVDSELRCTMTILNQSRDKKLVVKKLELILQDDTVN